MKVILLQDIPGLGKKGGIAQVKGGHAINFLIPQKKAAAFTPENKSIYEKTKNESAKKEEKKRTQYQNILSTISRQKYVLQQKSNENGRLFQAVHEHDIRRSIEEQASVSLDAAQLISDRPIKEKGDHTVTVRFPGAIQGTIQLSII